MKQEIAVGKAVRILNTTYGGKVVIEGIAIVKKVRALDIMTGAMTCLVKFPDGEPVVRFVEEDPDAMLQSAREALRASGL